MSQASRHVPTIFLQMTRIGGSFSLQGCHLSRRARSGGSKSYKDDKLPMRTGGATTVAYRDDEKLELKPRDKRAQCKRFVIELEARTPSSATSADFLIAASRPSARARPLSPPSANGRGMSSYPKAFSGHQILEQAAE